MEPETEVAVADGDFDIDVGNMLLLDKVAPSVKLTEQALQDMARDRAQHLVASLFALPTHKLDYSQGGGRLAVLPVGTTVIPREKPPPKDKPSTKWEEFRKEKGLKKRKKDGKIYDEPSGKWLPAYGMKRRREERLQDWVREVPANYQPLEEGGDPFLDDKIRRRERVQKQKRQQDSNVKRMAELERSSALAGTSGRLATASMGKFDSSSGAGKLKGLKKNNPKVVKKNKVAMQRRRKGGK